MNDMTNKAMTLEPCPFCLAEKHDNGEGCPALNRSSTFDLVEQREGEAVGEYLANVDEYGGIRWIGAKPPHGTKLYTAPPHPRVEVTDEIVRHAWRAYRKMQRESKFAPSGLECMRAALEAALGEKS
jgi:hypothetical protein